MIYIIFLGLRNDNIILCINCYVEWNIIINYLLTKDKCMLMLIRMLLILWGYYGLYIICWIKD